VGRFQRLRDILTTFGPELKKQTIIMVERAKFTYNKKIQDSGDRHNEFRKISISPGQTMCNDSTHGFQHTCSGER